MNEEVLQKLREGEMKDYWEKYEEGLFGRKQKRFCDDCIEHNKKRANGKFYPKCFRSTDEHADDLIGKVPKDHEALARLTVDPVEWAKFEFDWDPRWYQAQVLRCTSQKQAWRWGRRSGKSTVLAVKSLFLCAAKPLVGVRDPYTTLVITPYESQLDRIFDMARDLVAHCKSFEPWRDIRDPHTLEWRNGSKMIGFTAGEKTGARSVKIRGQDA
ncbi:MAG: hypothetical protein GTO63_06260, partial [Anaerolineae bacterium]|nr:hypothetical protein [Anaerolineae bacterium]NIN93606.1 hypothetical protein [Anaerolineae bacterium]NIQ77648.1 hypothetical protein [Anaerolineae bacterium]